MCHFHSVFRTLHVSAYTGHHQVLILLGKLLHSCICFSLFLVCCLKYSSLMRVKCLLLFFGAAYVVFTVIIQE
jgi:hypothetical protein